MKKQIVRFLLALSATGCFLSAHAAENMAFGGYSAFGGVGSSGSSTSASVFKAEYERRISDLMTFTAGVAKLSYTSTNSGAGWTYSEDGNGTGAFVDLNFYPQKQSFKGFYVGPGVGLTSISSTWTEYNAGFPTFGSYSASVFDIHGKAGWKFNAGPVVIDPNVRIGYFLNAPKGGTANTNLDATLGFYMLFGVNVGVPF